MYNSIALVKHLGRALVSETPTSKPSPRSGNALPERMLMISRYRTVGLNVLARPRHSASRPKAISLGRVTRLNSLDSGSLLHSISRAQQTV